MHRRIECEEGIPQDQQRLTFKRKLLKDSRTLADCKVGPGSILTLTEARRPPSPSGNIGSTAMTARQAIDALAAFVDGEEGGSMPARRLIHCRTCDN